MNLLDQLELYSLRIGNGRVTQKAFWLFVYESMKSGLLMTRAMENHLKQKLQGLGAELKD